jgi:hypothetical protein
MQQFILSVLQFLAGTGRSLVLVVALFTTAGVFCAGYFAIAGAGRCPKCGCPTVWTWSQTQKWESAYHQCVFCGGTYHRGEHGAKR